jgi:hypothetical protein
VLRGSRDDMPMAVQSRAFVIVMKKGKPRIGLPKKYLEDPDLLAARDQAEAWAATSQLNLDPDIPQAICRDRSQDRRSLSAAHAETGHRRAC